MFNFFQNNIELQIFIYSMLPIIELRWTIPYFILYSDLNWFKIFLIAVSSNISIGIFVRYLVSPLILILDKLSTIYKEAKKQFVKLKFATQLQELRKEIRGQEGQDARLGEERTEQLKQQLSTLEKQSLFYARYCLLNTIIIFNRHNETYYNLSFDQLLIYHMFCLLQFLFDIDLESDDDAIDVILSGAKYKTIQEINELIREKDLSIQLEINFSRLNTAKYAIDIGLDTALPLTCEQMYYEVDSCELIFRDDPEPVPVQINENSYDIAQYFEIQFNAMKKESPLDESSILLLYHSNRNT